MMEALKVASSLQLYHLKASIEGMRADTRRGAASTTKPAVAALTWFPGK
jgi:hypothetical protein